VLTALVRLARKDLPRLKYVHLVNEANAYWFSHYADPGAIYVDYFLHLARRLHREFPGIQVGGPVHCWPPHYPPVQEGLPNWYTWEKWSQPLIEAAGRELGFFDYHYGTTSEDTTFSLRVVTAAAMRAHGYRLKSVISEARAERLEWDLSADHGKGKVNHGPMPPDALRVETREKGASLAWQAAPWASYALYATIPGGIEPPRFVRQEEFFGDVMMGTLSPDRPSAEVTVDVDAGALAAAHDVVVRIGLLDVARDHQVTVSADPWQRSLPRPRTGVAVIKQMIVDGELKAVHGAGVDLVVGHIVVYVDGIRRVLQPDLTAEFGPVLRLNDDLLVVQYRLNDFGHGEFPRVDHRKVLPVSGPGVRRGTDLPIQLRSALFDFVGDRQVVSFPVLDDEKLLLR
jgi:hypothetical protein